MDQDTRNRLRNVVTACRRMLEESVEQVLQGQFDIYATGKNDAVHADEKADLKSLSVEDRAYRTDIIAHLRHIEALGYTGKTALKQLVREIAFTHLNRLCAYKMMAAREVWVGGQRFRDVVGKGMQSQGFDFYLAKHDADKRLSDEGRRDLAYRHYLNWVGGLLSEEIGVLFSPNDPANRLYPPQRVLDGVLAELNGDDLKDVWGADETIGWVYQYFTPKELRDEVRKESQAPRNSYELAFRNQFFTPRYVVEFLTDNTLGRIWYEMRRGKTQLAEQCRYMVRRPTEVFLDEGQSPPAEVEANADLSQDELLKLPVFVPFRAKKDPRELRVLDPACGSGHFLLYCFDLLLTIYEEAYTDPDLGQKLRDEYATIDDLRRDAPRLILAHNLHGIDIDPRAAQIAALALWLRCQRRYRELGLKENRPKISRSNIVCAEPMPGERQMLKEFVNQELGSNAAGKLLGQLVEVVFDKMKLAGEAGSLLKIEDEIRKEVAEAKRQFEKGGLSEQPSLPGMENEAKGSVAKRYAVRKLQGREFFEQAEDKVVEALRAYAEKAHNGDRMKRRLFADDAVRGFAFVEMCHQRFDVVLMNPPFGEPVATTAKMLQGNDSGTANNLYTAFHKRATTFVADGKIGAIESRTFITYHDYAPYREELLLGEATALGPLADLGWSVLDEAQVETAALITTHSRIRPVFSPTPDCGPFFRILDVKAEDKGHVLLQCVAGDISERVFYRSKQSFGQLSKSPLCYWSSEQLIEKLARSSRLYPTLAYCGLGASPHAFFFRLFWETPLTISGTERYRRIVTVHGVASGVGMSDGAGVPFRAA